MLTLATSALASSFRAGKNLAAYAATNPKKATALGVGIGTAGILAANTKSIHQSLSGNKSNTMDTSADSSYFTAPSDLIKGAMYVYGENPVTSLALGFGGNYLLDKYGGEAGLRRYAHKLYNADKAGISSTYLTSFTREMKATAAGAKKAASGPLRSRIWQGIKNVARASRPDSDALKAAEKYIARTPGVAGSKAGEKMLARIGFIKKAKALNNIASFGWAASMAYDMGKSFFTGSMPAFNVPTIRTTSMGGTFNDSSEAYTQRRRAIEAMHNSQYSGRSAFGNEASLMHA